MKHENHGVPNGIGHLRMLDQAAPIALHKSRETLQQELKKLEGIGICLTVLYQAATCHRKCYATGHVLEYLSGRAYNLAAAAFQLAKIGYYDEALNLIRGIGEIGNLVTLGAVDSAAIPEWIAAEPKVRRNKFSPSEVRKRLKKKTDLPLIADDGWYAELCEKYTHVTPVTKPNLHEDQRPRCGGMYQQKGLQEAINQLELVLFPLALLTSKQFEFDDLFEELASHFKESEKTDIKTE